MNGRVFLGIVAFTSLLLLCVACGDEDSTTAPTVTTSTETATLEPSSPPPATAGPTTAGGPNEDGQSPVFWRTADNFAGVIEQVPYLAVFRVEGGFAEPSLTVTAVCTSCPDPDEQTFVGSSSTPVGEDAPGAYYPTSMTFPRAGRWELTVLAEPDEVTIPIDVQTAP